MYKLQQLNVVKVVETDAARDDLIARGFVDVAGANPRAAAVATEEKTEKPPTKRRASAKAR